MKHWNSKLLEQLLQVQDTDLKIRGLDIQIQLHHQRSKEEDGELSRIKGDINRIDEALVNTESQNQMYATTLEDIRSAIKGLLTTKAGVPKPRTRSSTEALKIEEEKLESLVEETAEQLVKLKDERENLLSKAEARNVELESDNEGPEAEIRKLQLQIRKLEQQRQQEISGIPSLLLKHYDRLRSSRSGIGLTVIRDGVCTVCCMQMPTAIISKLAHGEKIDMCPACGRMVARIEHNIPAPSDASDAAVEERPSRKMRRVKSSILKETADERKAALKKTLKKKIAGLDAARAAEIPSERKRKEASTANKKARDAAAESNVGEKVSAKKSTRVESEAKLSKKTAAKKPTSPLKAETAPKTASAPAEKKTAKSGTAQEAIPKSSGKKGSKKTDTKPTPVKPESQKARTKKVAPKKKEAPKAATAKKSAPKPAASKATGKKAAVRKPAPKPQKDEKKATPSQKPAPKKPAPKKSAPKKPAPKKSAPKKPAKSSRGK